MKAKKDGIDPNLCQEMTLNRYQNHEKSKLNEPTYDPISGGNKSLNINFNKDLTHLMNMQTGCI